MKLEPGLLIGDGKYKLAHCLGFGGQAEVWEAEQQGLAGFTKSIVLKLVTPGRRGDQRLYQNLLREAQLSSLLHHPNIAEVYDVGQDEGLLYIAMERIQGKDLEHVLQRCLEHHKTPIPWKLAVLMVADVCKGLHHVHTKEDASGEPLHLIHRDLKPSNILLSQDGYVKVIDFGVAKAATSTQVTRQGAVRGTPAYMAPEQIRSQPTDGRADLFSMGAVLYELCTGQRAFLDEDLYALFYAVLSKTPKAPTQIIPTLPKSLEKIITKAMAKSPAARYQEAREMEQALQSLLREQDVYPETEQLAVFFEELLQDNPPMISLESLQDSSHRSGQTMSYGLPTAGPTPLAEQQELAEFAPPDGRSIQEVMEESAGVESSPSPDDIDNTEVLAPPNEGTSTQENEAPAEARATQKQPAPDRPKPPKFMPAGQSNHAELPPPPKLTVTKPTPYKTTPDPTLRHQQPTSFNEDGSHTHDESDEDESAMQLTEDDFTNSITGPRTIPPPPIFGIPKKLEQPSKSEEAATTRAHGFVSKGPTETQRVPLEIIAESIRAADAMDSPADTQQIQVDDLSTDPSLHLDQTPGKPEKEELGDTQKITLPPASSPADTLREDDTVAPVSASPIPAPHPSKKAPEESPASPLPASLSLFAAMIDGQGSGQKSSQSSGEIDDDVLAFSFPSETTSTSQTFADATTHGDVFDEEELQLGWGIQFNDSHRRFAIIAAVGFLFLLGGGFLFFGGSSPKKKPKARKPSLALKKQTLPRVPARMSSWQTFQVGRDTPPRKPPHRLPILARPRMPDPVLLPLPRRQPVVAPQVRTNPTPQPALRPPPVRRAAKGTIRFRLTPTCTLYAGRRKLGHSSRLVLRRRRGRYRFRCVNHSLKLIKELSVRVKAGRRVTVRRRYRKGTLFVVSYPWASVALPPFGKLGYSQAAISLWEGRYTLQLYRQGRRQHRKRLRVRIRAGRTTRPAVVRW